MNRIGSAPGMWHLARSLRIEFPDALYHITARDDRQERIYADQEDWERFLPLLGEVVEDPNWLCHACCLITNHYHLVVGTREGNLSKRRRQLNGVYTQAYNRRHRQVGHLFQGKYKAVLVEAERYLLELARYVVLDPVRAGMVREPGGWAWSSYNATVGETVAPPWARRRPLLGHFAAKRSIARRRNRRFVRQGVGQGSIWTALNRQIYWGDERFVERMQAQRESRADDVNIAKVQRRAPARYRGRRL